MISQSCADFGFAKSFFERCPANAVDPFLLSVQYRMHAEIRAWPSLRFYGDQLRDGTNIAAPPVAEHRARDPRLSPYAFLDLYNSLGLGQEQRVAGAVAGEPQRARLRAAAARLHEQALLTLALYERRLIFTWSAIFVISPYVIAWTACSSINAKQQKKYQEGKSMIGCMLFNIYHWLECVFIKPWYFLFTCGKETRTVSYGELGYYKMRRVSEIISETLPQACLQLFIMLFPKQLKVSQWTVVAALSSSLFILALWVTVLFVEGKVRNAPQFED